MSAPQLTLEATSPSHPDARALIIELNELLNRLYHPEDNHFSLDDEDVEGSRGIFLLARLGDQVVGCGAVRLLADGRAELKRMYVRPESQGSGVGRAILSRLEQEARARSALGLVLEMGDQQPAAHRLYESAGFRPVPCWGEYLATPNSICLGKELP